MYLSLLLDKRSLFHRPVTQNSACHSRLLELLPVCCLLVFYFSVGIHYSSFCNIASLIKIMVINNILGILKSGFNAYTLIVHTSSLNVFYFFKLEWGGGGACVGLSIVASSLNSFCAFTINCSIDKSLP